MTERFQWDDPLRAVHPVVDRRAVWSHAGQFGWSGPQARDPSRLGEILLGARDEHMKEPHRRVRLGDSIEVGVVVLSPHLPVQVYLKAVHPGRLQSGAEKQIGGSS